MAPSVAILNPPSTNVPSRNDEFKLQARSADVKAPRTIDELIQQRAEELPNQAILSYPSSGIDYVDYSFQDLNKFASLVAERYKTLIPPRSSSQDAETVVGLLGPSNLEYFITTLALSKLGHTVLFLSTRISMPAYVSLLQATGAQHIVIETTFRETIDLVKRSFPELNVHDIAGKSVWESPFPGISTSPDIQFSPQLDLNLESSKLSWIIHSSGSTGLPKPIYQTHRAALQNYGSNLSLRGFVTLPLYHAHGLSSVFRAIHSRKQIYLYNADLPLTQRHLLNIMQRYEFQIFYGVPYALKLLGESAEGIAALAKLDVVMFGGSACPDPLGNRLVNNDVNLISHYGTTETGQLMTSARPRGDKAWDYVRVPEAFKSLIRFEERGAGIYELIALEGLPSKVASNRPDGSYATKDLFTAHSSIPDAWKYFARLDDTIVLVNGEKVVPIAFEQSIRDHVYVREAVMFGSGRDRVGMLIILSSATQDLSQNDIERSLVPDLTHANEQMPAYAQVILDMVKILPHDTEYPRTDKGTAIRAAFYRKFEAEIEEIYQNADVSTGTLCLSEVELKQYIRTELDKVLPQSSTRVLGDATDFFSIGVDSLQAIQLRSALSKEINTNGEKLASNIVFDFPSVESLAQELYRLGTGGDLVESSVLTQMENLIAKYSNFEAHSPVETTKEGHYLVVTGASGSLGAHLVSQLILNPEVKKVYCFVRASSKSNARTRVVKSLRERSVYHNLPVEARRKIVAVPTDFTKASLGLEPDLYNQIASEISAVVHCAWSVNFNLGLTSFEADCIAGTHNLIMLCLRAQRPEPATFNFCSSVSAVAHTKGGFVPEALPESLEFAQNMGYAQSKVVAENICVAASKSCGIKSRVLRVGQVIADTIHGTWNGTEAIPLMMQAGLTMGAIPKLDESPLWLPVDVVAAAVAEVSLSNAGTAVVNIVNHQSFHWSRDLLPALHRAGLEFLEPGQREWVALLRKSNPDPVSNPPIKLVEFFANKYDNDLSRESLVYDTSYARFLSPSLAAAPVLNQELVNKFVRKFQATSWTTTPLTNLKKKLIVIAGPCGAGKSTVAEAISKEYNIPWIEGDSLHSKESIDKMSAGTALSDDDRWLWLETIKAHALLRLSQEQQNAIVVTCSALKHVYREELRRSRVLETDFILLQGTESTFKHRVQERKDHYIGVEMVDSQLDCLEPPDITETDIFPVDATLTKGDVIAEVLSVFEGFDF